MYALSIAGARQKEANAVAVASTVNAENTGRPINVRKVPSGLGAKRTAGSISSFSRVPGTWRSGVTSVSSGTRSQFGKHGRDSVRRDSGIILGRAESKTPRGPHIDGALQILSILDGPSDVMCLRFSPNGQLIAVGYSDGSIKIFQVDTQEYLYYLHPDENTDLPMPVTCLRFLPSSSSDNTERRHTLMATYASGCIRFWLYPSSRCLYTINEMRLSGVTLAAAFNYTGQHLVSVGADFQLHLYDVETKRRLSTLYATENRDVMDGHRDRVFAVQYHSSDLHVFLSGGWDNTVQYWDSRNRNAFRRFYGPHICGDALDLDPVYSHILTGSWRKDNQLQVWDFSSGNKIADVPQHVQQSSMLYCAQWHGTDAMICGGTGANLARLTDRASFSTIGQLVELAQGVYCIDNDRRGSNPRIAIGSSKSVYLVRAIPLV